MEIYIQKTEKVHITKEQQRDIALKVVEEVFYRTIRHKGFNDLREKRELGAKEGELYACNVTSDYHHGGDDISWIRKATEEESTLYNSVESLKKLIHEYPNK
jgi:hypothetical protein